MAAAIIARLPAGASADAYPMIGSGAAYEGICPLVGPRAHIPSEGWRNTSGSLMRDLRGGLLSSLAPALRFMRNVRKAYPRIVVVGDLMGVLLAFQSRTKITAFVDVFRNAQAHSYAPPERWIIRKTAKMVFCRDEELARVLRADGIDARSAGNLMMDTIPYGDYDVAGRRTRPRMVAILPGSRATALEHFSTQVSALKELSREALPDFFVVVAPSVTPQALAEASGLKFVGAGQGTDLGRLEGGGLTLHLVRGALGNVVEASDVVLSQAGTASWQAIGLGKPVITFVMPGDRPKRLRDEAAFTGESRIVCRRDSVAIAAELSILLADPEERARRGRIGRQRMGPPGAIDAIVKAIA